MKHEVLGRICDSGLVPVIRAAAADEATKIADACLAGGAVAIEITFTVPGAANVLNQLAQRQASSTFILGAGTVLNPETARIAIMSGAKFVVSPALNRETARLCTEYQIPYVPGAGTVREVIEAMECGAEIVKLFPAETMGPAFAKAVKAVLPQAALMPTGGVTVANVHEWIAAGCVAVGVGSNLTGSAKRGDFQTITTLTKQFLDEIRKARA
jgi:2-dehydro-3-deoxyphosphogluconate aldolase/(4S)-4-hydroxy-2-oxoglutarate aldolase